MNTYHIHIIYISYPPFSGGLSYFSKFFPSSAPHLDMPATQICQGVQIGWPFQSESDIFIPWVSAISDPLLRTLARYKYCKSICETQPTSRFQIISVCQGPIVPSCSLSRSTNHDIIDLNDSSFRRSLNIFEPDNDFTPRFKASYKMVDFPTPLGPIKQRTWPPRTFNWTWQGGSCLDDSRDYGTAAFSWYMWYAHVLYVHHL